MGITSSKKRRPNEEEFRGLMEKIRLLQKEINEIMDKSYEREEMVLVFKEAEWKEERKMLKEEVKRLRKSLEGKEERIREMEDGKEWELMGNGMLVETMEERVFRDEAGEKWKQLYLAIKTELDHLIYTTNSVDGMYRRAKEEDDIMEELKMELEAKEETIEALKAELNAVKHEEVKCKREKDILRQSLRIMSNKKNPTHFEKHY